FVPFWTDKGDFSLIYNARKYGGGNLYGVTFMQRIHIPFRHIQLYFQFRNIYDGSNGGTNAGKSTCFYRLLDDLSADGSCDGSICKLFSGLGQLVLCIFIPQFVLFKLCLAGSTSLIQVLITLKILPCIGQCLFCIGYSQCLNSVIDTGNDLSFFYMIAQFNI